MLHIRASPFLLFLRNIHSEVLLRQLGQCAILCHLIKCIIYSIQQSNSIITLTDRDCDLLYLIGVGCNLNICFRMLFLVIVKYNFCIQCCINTLGK